MSLHAQGLRAWLWQRLTAVYIALFVIASLILYAFQGPYDYSQWQALFTDPVVNIATALFVIATLFHAGVGIRDILVDYVPLLALRFMILVLLLLMLIALGIWSMWTLILVVV
jgi:succinate dehydrogenase / fumarate reductase membrane anchor subunit